VRGQENAEYRSTAARATIVKILSLNVAHPRLTVYKGTTINTGIFKQPVSHRIKLRTLNLEGDQQADLSVHGGPYKAVYAYR
jgi:MOSC domain-containing protein YiiM